MKPLKAGWHRCIARDGTVAAMLVDDTGTIREFMLGHKEDPPKRVSRRFIGTVEEVRERAERRRIEREIRIHELFTTVRGRL